MTKSNILNDSFSEFVSHLKKIDIDSNYEYVFRGHSEAVNEILPRIYRTKWKTNVYPVPVPANDLGIDWSYDTKEIGKTIINNEDKIFREIILRSPQDFTHDNTAIEKLVKMQHYGLPTRILDVTSNPLVALYFACTVNPQNKNGEVIIFKIHKEEIKFYDSDSVSILSNVAKMKSSFSLPKLEMLMGDKDSFNDTHEIALLLHEIRDEKPHFLPVIEPDDFNRVLPVKVKLNNNRIIRQNGSFLLYGIDKNKTNPAKIKDEWIVERIEVPHRNKSEIKKDLQYLGISESTLFPEIDYQARQLIEQYEYEILQQLNDRRSQK